MVFINVFAAVETPVVRCTKRSVNLYTKRKQKQKGNKSNSRREEKRRKEKKREEKRRKEKKRREKRRGAHL